jgi:hypothetical protein
VVEPQKDTQPEPLTAQTIDEGGSLVPMLVAGLVLIVLGYFGIMIFV